jgi:hypothetical protein
MAKKRRLQRRFCWSKKFFTNKEIRAEFKAAYEAAVRQGETRGETAYRNHWFQIKYDESNPETKLMLEQYREELYQEAMGEFRIGDDNVDEEEGRQQGEEGEEDTGLLIEDTLKEKENQKVKLVCHVRT